MKTTYYAVEVKYLSGPFYPEEEPDKRYRTALSAYKAAEKMTKDKHGIVSTRVVKVTRETIEDSKDEE